MSMLREELHSYEDMATPTQIYEYQCKAGSLLYATIVKWPDTNRTASKLARSLLNPGSKHQEIVLRAITYLMADSRSTW